MVVDDQHPQRRHDGFLGSTARTTVPPPGRGSSSSEPPSSSARSRIVSSPDPVAGPDRAGAVVGDADHQVPVAPLHRHLALVRAGVPQDVGQRLLHDPVGGHLDGGRGGVGVLGHQPHLQAVGRRAVDEPPQRSHQAELVERDRPQPVHQPADVDDRRLHVAPHLAQQRVVAEAVAGGVQLQGQSGQRGTQPVVQVATQPAPLLLAGDHQPLPGAEQVRAQPGRLDRRRQRPGQRGEDLLVPPPARSAVDDQGPDDGARVHEGQLPAGVGRGARLGEDVAVRCPDRQRLQAQVIADRGQDVGQRPVGAGRLLQPGVETPDQRMRLVPGAVGQPVHAPLQPLPQRLEADGHHGRGQQRQPAGAAGVEHRAHPADDEHVDRDDGGGEQRVEQGRLTSTVDLVEPVLEDGDPDGYRQRDDRERVHRRREHPGRQERRRRRA